MLDNNAGIFSRYTNNRKRHVWYLNCSETLKIFPQKNLFLYTYKEKKCRFILDKIKKIYEGINLTWESRKEHSTQALSILLTENIVLFFCNMDLFPCPYGCLFPLSVSAPLLSLPHTYTHSLPYKKTHWLNANWQALCSNWGYSSKQRSFFHPHQTYIPRWRKWILTKESHNHNIATTTNKHNHGVKLGKPLLSAFSQPSVECVPLKGLE